MKIQAPLALFAAALLTMSCAATIEPPADLLSYRSNAENDARMREAEAIAPETYKQGTDAHAQAEAACTKNNVEQCQHYSLIAKLRQATALEKAAEQRSE